jgi:hypothetical protein
MTRLTTYAIRTRTIQEGKALTPPKYKRVDFSGTQEEKAYLIGFRLGDLYVTKTHPNSPTIRVSTNSGKKEQLLLFRELFSPYGHVKEIGPDKQGASNIRTYLNRSFNFLLPKKSDPLPKWIVRSKKNSLSFFAGYVDAEATFCINNRNQPTFAIQSQDKEILQHLQSKVLPSIGVSPRLLFSRKAGSVMTGIRSNKDVFGIYVYNRKDLNLIIKNILPLLRHGKRRKNALSVLKLISHGRS